MVVVGFLAELSAVALIASDRRGPVVLALMVVGLGLVVLAVILLSLSRRGG